MPDYTHFEGKSVPSHLIDARAKGAMASAEIHGTEISGQKAAFMDALRDSALAASLLSVLLFPYLQENILLPLLLFLGGWVLWKTSRSACLGWIRLSRLHRLIEEERWEIEHHRDQEKEELIAIYKAKGFSGNLLTQVIDVLMADDNRLLQVMLDEELNIPLEALEHPLKQASGAFIGSLLSLLIVLLSSYVLPLEYLPYVLAVPFLAATWSIARIERGRILPSMMWNLSLFALCIGTIYFLTAFFVAL